MTTSYTSPLPESIDELWERRSELTPDDAEAREIIVGAVDQIDAGKARVAHVDPETDEVVVDQRAKRAILLSFRVLGMEESTVGGFHYHDRIPLKTRLDGGRAPRTPPGRSASRTVGWPSAPAPARAPTARTDGA